jgi:glyceraldehyde-3-phosphate dehydrogenase/erythrose-4-phosphate dehydrogenase
MINIGINGFGRIGKCVFLQLLNFLINEQIDSISVTPDSALKTIKNIGI